MKYKTIVIDPPWPVKFFKRKARPNQVKFPYKTMTMDEIEKFPIDDFADKKDCKLFLWTTHKFLPNCFKILDLWGFKYSCCFTWDKQNGMCFQGIHKRTEFVLFAYRGSIPMFKKGKALPTFFAEYSKVHSRKPDIFFNMIKEGMPEPRISIFEREKRDGFDIWGDEAPE